MPLDEALRIARIVVTPGAQTTVGARVVQALLDYIEVLELERARPLPALAEVRGAWGPPPVERIEVQR